VRPTPQQDDDRGPACPPWCRRAHRSDDHAEDLLHQSAPVFLPVVRLDPWSAPGYAGWADDVVLRLVQQFGSAEVWLEASSEEGLAMRLLVTVAAARRLADAVAELLAVL
jgi:hypothetical protein